MDFEGKVPQHGDIWWTIVVKSGPKFALNTLGKLRVSEHETS